MHGHADLHAAATETIEIPSPPSTINQLPLHAG
jgi:hypothetical protein